MIAARLLGSMGVQGLGAAASLLAGLCVARWQGPVAQGEFSLLRNSTDLILTLALLGLPQALVPALHQGGAAPAAVLRLCWRYGLACLLPALWLAGLAVGWTGAGLAVGLVAAAWLVHGLLRVLVLCRGDTLRFAWMTALPNLALLAGLLPLLLLDSRAYGAALLVSGLFSLLLGWRLLQPLRSRPDWTQGGDPALRPLLTDGLHGFAQTLVLALQPWLSLHWLGEGGAQGHFALALLVYQAFGLPVSFVAPLLLARVSAAQAGRPLPALAARLRLAGTAMLACCLLAALLLPLAVTRGLGADYAPAVLPCVLLALCAPALLFNRLRVAMLLGEGRFVQTSLQAGLRLLLFALSLLVLPRLWPGLAAVEQLAWAWLATEWGAAAMLLRRKDITTGDGSS